MITIKKLLQGVTFMLLVTCYAQAQQAATYAQYMFNGLAINPAYAGSQGALTATALARFQNVGLPGAPNTQTFSIHSPLLNKKVALGLLMVNDKIGVINNTGVNAIYAYRIPLNNKKTTLSFGLQAGIGSYRADYTRLEKYHQNDPAFSQDVREAKPNFGAGIFYSSRYSYIGLSMPHMLGNAFERDIDFKTVNQDVPVILSGGYVIDINRMYKLKPNFLFKVVNQKPVELDLNANLLIDNVVWVGLSYKSSRAVALLTEVQLTDQLLFGYSYTITAGPIRTVEVGSHEVMLSYRFVYSKKGVVNPRYF